VFASKTAFGLIKIGSGIDENDAVIDVQPVAYASATVFGVVKLGADFLLNANGAMEVVKSGDEEMVIYDLAKMKILYASFERGLMKRFKADKSKTKHQKTPWIPCYF
ncbi:MAG: hypothetical protein LBB25_01095, partial [Holosporaceae bacterium]|nr:hypothetical protein [Holosporaceae bacterium]